MPNQIYFIDSKLNNYQTIIDSLASTDIYYLIDSSSDGLVQISNILLNYSNLDSIHVYSHGDIGSLNIGNTVYDNTNISNYKIELENIGKSLSSTGDILLYGCNVGQDEVGKNFINQIAQFSQADVAASDDLTGNSNFGGDWDLEVKSGIIEASVKPIEKIDSIKIVQVDGLNRGSSGGGDSGAGTGEGNGNLAEQAVSAALSYRAQQPILDAVLNEIGMKGGDLQGLVESVRKDL